MSDAIDYRPADMRSFAVASALVAGLGAVVMLAWYLHWPRVVQIHPTFVPMQHNTALGFLLTGLAGVFACLGRGRWAKPVALGVAGLTAATLSQYMFDVSLGIDEFFVRHDITVRTSHPGRMAPATAISFLLMSAAIYSCVSLRARNSRAVSAILSTVVISLSLVSIFGYLADVSSAYTWGRSTAMAMHTASAFAALSLALLASLWRAEGRWMPRWSSMVFGLLVLGVSVQLWQALRANAQTARAASRAEQAESLRNLVDQRLDLLNLGLARMVERRVQLGSDWAGPDWTGDAENYVADYPSLHTLSMLNADGVVLRTVPVASDIAKRVPVSATDAVSVTAGSVQLLLPVADSRQQLGYLLAEIDTVTLVRKLGDTLFPVADARVLGIADAAVGTAAAAYADMPLRIGNTEFLLRVSFASDDELSPAIAINLVLITGLATAVLLTLTLRLLIVNRERGAELEQLNALQGERLLLANDRAGLGTWHWIAAQDRLDGSERFRELFGIAAGEAVSFERCVEAIHPDDREAAASAFNVAIKDRHFYETEYRVLHPDGRTTWLLSAGRGYYDKFGRADRVEGFVQDITNRKQTEFELRRTVDALALTNRDLQRFAYVASHDLQEPLRTVVSHLQLLESRYRGQLDADGEAFIGYAVNGAKRMKRLIEGLLQVSRVGERGFQQQPCDMGELLQRIENDRLAVLQEQGAVITHDLLPIVSGDAGQLERLLGQLIDNALRYKGSAAAQIHVSAEPADATEVMLPDDTVSDAWLIGVHDNGVGIDVEYTESVFDIFRRLDADERHLYAGVGLTLCRKIVEMHGGRIWVVSAGSDAGGSSLYFTLPCAPTMAAGNSAGGRQIAGVSA